MTFICLHDKCEVCNIFMPQGKHKGHDIMAIKQIKHEVTAKKKNIKAQIEKLYEHYSKVNLKVEEGQID